MDRLIYTAMTGASQALGRQASVANNLANVSTTGYRAVQVNAQGASKALPTRAFVVDASIGSNFAQGPMQMTGRTLDVAIEGRGWIGVVAPDGTEGYTRNGSLELSVNGVLQTRNGLPVQGDGGPISVPPDVKISIGRDGTVSVVPETGAQTVSSIGRIKLVNPPEADLERGADGLFRLRDGGAAPISEQTQLASGFLEGANVNAIDQMVSMISLARQFEMQTKLISNASENDRAATQVIAQL